MRRLIIPGAIAVVVFLTTSSFAFPLTEEDLEYLKTHGVEKAGPLIQGLSPRETARMHALITDLRTKDDPVARRKAIEAALNEHREHQSWEIMNPGKLWNAREREIFKR